MWIELVARDEAGAILFESGKLAKHTDDLCDANTFGEANNPLKREVVGCEAVDDQLVNIQLKLVDRIAIAADQAGVLKRGADGEFVVIQAKDGHETFLQHLTGGAVVRTRPSDQTLLAPIKVGEERAFTY